jgi:tetratricopeptide (TPR) repeat protein
MARFGLGLLVCAGLWSALSQTAAAIDPLRVDEDAAFKNVVAIQHTMQRAHYLLFQERDAKKAVQILEENLARINGNADYLRLLRDAYRAYVQDLKAARQTALIEKYQQRLAILDPESARPKANANPDKGLAQLTPSPYLSDPKIIDPKTGKPVTVRAKIEDDPFDLAHQRIAPGRRLEEAQKLLAQANAEFARNRYKEASFLYEQAAKADGACISSSKQRWAYCKLSNVVERLNQGNLTGSVLPGLEREVKSAVEMAPGLEKTGKWLLGEMDRRRQPVLASTAAAADTPIQHKGRTRDGWQLAETAHFRIFHNQSKEFVEKVALVAERTRREMQRKWFNGEAPEWNPKCDLYLHANAQEYTRLTSYSSQLPGHSSFYGEANGRITVRRMDLRCDIPTMLDCVLPHETTHVVLAGQFGRHAVPRWADEGMAVLTEPKEKIDQHRRTLARNYRQGGLFNVKDLMNMHDYPHARHIGVFYAQSVVLVDYLTRLKGPQAFAAFLRDGLDMGYEAALRKHYGMRDFNDLQTRWNRQVLATLNSGSPAIAGR